MKEVAVMTRHEPRAGRGTVLAPSETPAPIDEAEFDEMKVDSVSANNHRKGFEVCAEGNDWFLPFSVVKPEPTSTARVAEVAPDPEIGCEGFTYRLENGQEGTVHLDAVRAYNRDPAYVRKGHLYELTLEALRRADESPLSKRELIRRLNTSASQLYRLLDPTNYTKSIDQMIVLLTVLGCEVRIEYDSES